MKKQLLLALALLVSTPMASAQVGAGAVVQAQTANPTAVASALRGATGGDLAGDRNPERGWFFFEDPPKPAEPDEPPLVEPKPVPPFRKPPPPTEETCRAKATWTAECGFVDPGEDFEFQSRQRDELLNRMVVAKNDPKAVEAFQYYMRWVLQRTSEVTNLWWYNMVQNPELDPTAANPVSAFGLRLMTDVRNGKAKEIYELIKEEDGMFVYFSRYDCEFCHRMANPLRTLAKNTGIPVRNAAIDDKCMPGYEEGCLTAPQTLAPAQALQVTTVPAVFLYIGPNTWIRIATGAVDAQSMEDRAMQFFLAYRNAMLKGVENGEKARASVDFSGNALDGTSKGVAAEAGGPRLPSDAEIQQLLGQGR